MRLGLNLGYWGAGNDAANLALAQEADRLGFAVVWAAEAWGSDVVSVLSWVAAQTERVDVGSAVMQIPARTPAMTAMTAATLDTLSGGRFRLGLGVSGPQVSEGWHGVRFDKPLGRTREYVEIVRMAMRREKLEYAGEHYTLPLPDGPGKALKLIVHPVREHIPVYLAAVGPKNLELAGEIADGAAAAVLLARARRRLPRPGPGRPARRPGWAWTASTWRPPCPLSSATTRRPAPTPVRGYAALYVGGMGSREKNFYNQIARRMGFEREARPGAGPLPGPPAPGGGRRGAVASSSTGPRCSARRSGSPTGCRRYAESGVTTLTVSPVRATAEERVASLRAAGRPRSSAPGSREPRSKRSCSARWRGSPSSCRCPAPGT